jgi:hypothetical protein
MTRSTRPDNRRRNLSRWPLAIGLLIASTLLLVPGLVRNSNALLTDQVVVGANAFSTAAVFPSGGAYVWDQVVVATLKKASYRIEVTITVRTDSDGDGIAEISDTVLDAASVDFELRDAGGAVIASDSGTTDASGLFTTRRFNNIAAGSYTAVVTALTHGTETWVLALDAANPLAVAIP